MNKKIILLITVLLISIPLALMVGIVAGWNMKGYPKPLEEVSVQRDQGKLWRLIQAHKRAVGEPYIEDPGLCTVAEIRAKEISTEFSHKRFEEKHSHYLELTGMSVLGENIAVNYEDERETLLGWLASPLHREALDRDDLTYSCVRCSGAYCVQTFGKKN